jgi:hypothetical protein
MYVSYDFNLTRRFITVFTKASHWILPWAEWIQSTRSHPISLTCLLIRSRHLRLGLPSGLFPSVSPELNVPHSLCYLWRVVHCSLTQFATYRDVQLGSASSVSVVTWLRAWWLGFDSRQGQWWDFATSSRPGLGPTQPPVQGVPATFSPRVTEAGAWSWSLTSV